MKNIVALKKLLYIATMSILLVVLCSWSDISFAAKASFIDSEKKLVEGSWVRFDAPYVIVLSPNQNGELLATYFNPQPIRVEKTETAEKDGLLYILVRLRDVHYEGSFYLLSYERAKDLLLGSYFHAASGQQFEVGFKRKK